MKDNCDRATDFNETIVVTRKEEKNVVLISLDYYNMLMKAARNAEYLAAVDRALEQLRAGRGQQHDLLED